MPFFPILKNVKSMIIEALQVFQDFHKRIFSAVSILMRYSAVQVEWDLTWAVLEAVSSTVFSDADTVVLPEEMISESRLLYRLKRSSPEAMKKFV